MAEAGVALVPGAELVDSGDLSEVMAQLHARAAEVGFPLLLKASAGGGGKGMRAVDGAGELDSAYLSAQREAQSSFGDGRVYLERRLISPRHIEIQVLCDTHGNGVHLLERECSIQRRHQKVVEEAPSPHISESLRNEMGAAALAAAQSVHYVGAGTVEFLVVEGGFFFLEMNTLSLIHN